MIIQVNSLIRMALRLTYLKKSFSSKGSKDEPQRKKVLFDQESVNRKIKQLRQRSQNIISQPQPIIKKKSKQFMPSFTIPEVNKKVLQYRRESNTEDIFAFSDITLEEKPTVLQITSFSNQFFQVDGFSYPPAIILSPFQVLNWEIEDPQSVRIEHFSILKCINPIPQYVIIGLEDSSKIKQDLRQKLQLLHPNIDILNLFEAISQYNTVSSNDKNLLIKGKQSEVSQTRKISKEKFNKQRNDNKRKKQCIQNNKYEKVDYLFI